MMKKTIVLILLLSFLLSVASVYAATDNTEIYNMGYVEGYIKEISDNKVIIERYDGRDFELDISAYAQFKIDGYLVSITDFKPGMEVYAELRGRRITYLEGFSTQNTGYIKPGSKMRIGTIKSIDRNQLTVQLPSGKDEMFYLSPATIALKNSQSVPLNVLNVGDRVKLQFDDANTDIVSIISVEGDSILIKDLYKGKLISVDELEDVIVIENVQTLREGKWEDYEGTVKIRYSTDFPVYMQGQQINNQYLKYYKGKTIYAAVKDFFGQDRIERMVVKANYETIFSEKITDINWYSENIELSNNKNVSFNDGTIIVKSGRLIDKYSINPESDALLIADGRAQNISADVISIYNEDINNSNIGQNYIYSGELEQIVEGAVTVEDPFLIYENEWESYDDTKEFYYDNDTYIYDLEDNKLISPLEFYSGNYAIDESSKYAKDRNLRDWHGYIYSDGDRINVIGVQKKLDSLLRQRMTIGSVDNITVNPNVGPELTIREAKDWSSRHDEWLPKTISLKINLSKALIIKDDKLISYEYLKPSDRLYIVRDNYDGKIVIVK